VERGVERSCRYIYVMCVQANARFQEESKGRNERNRGISEIGREIHREIVV
jgi:hypothetical protein